MKIHFTKHIHYETWRIQQYIGFSFLKDSFTYIAIATSVLALSKSLGIPLNEFPTKQLIGHAREE